MIPCSVPTASPSLVSWPATSAREAYALDLRQFAAFCAEHGLGPLAVRRAHIDLFARTLEERGRARATVARRLCTVAGFYRYAEHEGLMEHSPAVHVRLASTTSLTPSGSTATSSAPSSSRPAWPRLETTPWPPSSPSTAYVSRRPWGRTSST